MSTTDSPTTASTDPTGRVVTKELFIAADPARVYRAFTEQGELQRWFVKAAEIELRLGGAHNLTWLPGEHVAGTVVELDPPRRFAFTWNDDLGVTQVAVECLPEADGTLLRLTHTGFGAGDDWDNYYAGVNSGWTEELEHLRVYLEDGTPKHWSSPERAS